MRQQRNALLAGLRRSTPRGVMQGDQLADLQDGIRGSLQGTPKGPPLHGRGGRQQRTCSEASTDSSRASSREGSPEGGRRRPARAAAAVGAAGPSGDQGSPRREMHVASHASADRGRYTGDRAPDASCSIRVGPPAAAKAPDGSAPEAQLDAWAAPESPAAPAPHAEPAPEHKLCAQAMDAASGSPQHSAMLSSLSDSPGDWARTPAAVPADPEPGIEPHPSSSFRAGTPSMLPNHPDAGGWARTPEPAARGEPLGSHGKASAQPPDGGHAEPWGCRMGPAQRSRLAPTAQRAAPEVGGNAFNNALADAGDAGLQSSAAAEGVLQHGDDKEWGDSQEGGAWGLQEGFGVPLYDLPLLARLANLKLVTDELLLEALL